jgi:hypothetical protein
VLNLCPEWSCKLGRAQIIKLINGKSLPQLKHHTKRTPVSR